MNLERVMGPEKVLNKKETQSVQKGHIQPNNFLDLLLYVKNLCSLIFFSAVIRLLIDAQL